MSAVAIAAAMMLHYLSIIIIQQIPLAPQEECYRRY
jgi:hypothetical protein